MKKGNETPYLSVETAKRLAKAIENGGIENRSIEEVRKSEGIHGRTWKVLVTEAVWSTHEEGAALNILRQSFFAHLLKDNEVLQSAIKMVSERQVKKTVKCSRGQSLSKAEKDYLIRMGHKDFVEQSESYGIQLVKIEETIIDAPPPVQLLSRLLNSITPKTAARFLK